MIAIPPLTSRIVTVDSYGNTVGARQIDSSAVANVPITIFSVGKIGALTPNATRYLLPDFTESTDVNFSAYIVPQPGIIDQLVCKLSTAPGGGEWTEIVVFLNGNPTSLYTIIYDTDVFGINVSDTISVVQGDIIVVSSVTSEFCVAKDLQVMLRHNTGVYSPAPPPT